MEMASDERAQGSAISADAHGTKSWNYTCYLTAKFYQRISY